MVFEVSFACAIQVLADNAGVRRDAQPFLEWTDVAGVQHDVAVGLKAD